MDRMYLPLFPICFFLIEGKKILIRNIKLGLNARTVAFKNICMLRVQRMARGQKSTQWTFPTHAPHIIGRVCTFRLKAPLRLPQWEAYLVFPSVFYVNKMVKYESSRLLI